MYFATDDKESLKEYEGNLEKAYYETVNRLNDCHRWCEREYPNWYKLARRSICKEDCNEGLTPLQIKCSYQCMEGIFKKVNKECADKCIRDSYSQKDFLQNATINDVNTPEDISHYDILG
ncbi:hypothetical protein [Wolbachia endosymbiont (group B) of Horisme vitalbata]|uniref:hypothetical protein n=1 Tax=Wolbachia endosymbiont (group B) of Horisme vitalbata TaxID=3066178 RepID=UPI00333E86CD